MTAVEGRVSVVSRHPFRLILVSAVSAVIASVLTSSPSHLDAATTDATCDGTITVTYSPGLTSTHRNTHVKDDEKLSSCTSTDATLKSGSSQHESDDPNLSCKPSTTVSNPQAHRKVITWNNGKTSTFEYKTQATQVRGDRKATHTGTIVAGEFTGDSAVGTTDMPDHNPASCDTAQGEASRTGTVHLTISKP
jgi:hypothetical protein